MTIRQDLKEFGYKDKTTIDAMVHLLEYAETGDKNKMSPYELKHWKEVGVLTRGNKISMSGGQDKKEDTFEFMMFGMLYEGLIKRC